MESFDLETCSFIVKLWLEERTRTRAGEMARPYYACRQRQAPVHRRSRRRYSFYYALSGTDEIGREPLKLK